MSRETNRAPEQLTKRDKSAPDVDYVEAEHDPEAARRASNAGIQRMLAPYLQRKAGPTAESSHETTHAAAADGIQAPARPLPHADKIQSSFGPKHDVSKVRAHIDPASAGAMGAEAFATGNDVVFAKEPDVKTAAHEVAHVVQQSKGVNLKGGVGEAGDAHEQNADAVAERVAAGQSAADLLGEARTGASPSHAVQRKPATEAMAERYDDFDESWQHQREKVADPIGAHVLDGGSSTGTELGDKNPGDAGYAAKLGKAGTEHAQEAMTKGDYGILAPQVEPYTLTIENGIQHQREWIAVKEKEKEDSKYTPSTKRDLFTLGLTQTGKDPDWVTKTKENSIARSGAQMAMLERHLFEQDRWVSSYNSWAPMANAAHGARADLIESAALMGFDLGKTGDMVKFVEGIEHGLDNATSMVDAKVAGPHDDTSWSGREGFKGNVGPGPTPEGDSIEPLFADLNAKYQAVNTAHLGIYQNLLDARTAVLEQDKSGKESKVVQINATIQFFTDMSGVVANGVAFAKAAPGAADAKLDHYAGQWAARRFENKAVDASRAGHHAESRFNVDRAETTRTTTRSEEPGSPGGMPSFGDMIGALVSASYEDELHTLQGQIASLTASIDAQKAVHKLMAAEKLIEDYRNKRKELVDAAKRIQVQTLAKREAQYLNVGDALDRYAVAHGSDLKSQKKGALVPSDAKHEIYSSLMLMVAKIRAYMLLADSARDMFPYDSFVEGALALANERQNPDTAPELQAAPSDLHWQPPRIPGMGKQENRQVWEMIDSTYAAAFGFSERARIQFGGIEEKVSKLLQNMKGVESKTNDVAENQY
jgi:hypothetical protein